MSLLLIVGMYAGPAAWRGAPQPPGENTDGFEVGVAPRRRVVALEASVSNLTLRNESVNKNGIDAWAVLWTIKTHTKGGECLNHDGEVHAQDHDGGAREEHD